MKILAAVLFVVVLLASPAVFADGLTVNYAATSTVENITPSSYDVAWTFNGPQTFDVIDSFTKGSPGFSCCRDVPGVNSILSITLVAGGNPPMLDGIHFFIEDINFASGSGGCLPGTCSTGVTSIYDASFTDRFFGTPGDGGDWVLNTQLIATVPTGSVVTNPRACCSWVQASLAFSVFGSCGRNGHRAISLT